MILTEDNLSPPEAPMLDLDLIRKYSVAAPRYTSYPPATKFTIPGEVDPQSGANVTGCSYLMMLKNNLGRQAKYLLARGDERSCQGS